MPEELLKQKKCFKLICGAGNQDIDIIEKLVAVYAAAGCRFFDISADNNVIAAAKKGLNRIQTAEKKYLCVSVGTKDDIHFQKAQIDKSICLECYKCVVNCSQKAIDTHLFVNWDKCIGCGKCADSCPTKSIFFEEPKIDLPQLFVGLNLENVDCIELHIGEEKDCFEKWEFLRNSFSGMMSICIGRKKFSDEKIIDILKKLLKNSKPYSAIIQADGSPMSGGVDNFESTLQAVAVGHFIKKAGLNQFVIVSGGTNSKTMEFARMCGADINGVAVGSFARKIVAEYIAADDFWENHEAFDKAVSVAKNFILNLFD